MGDDFVFKYNHGAVRTEVFLRGKVYPAFERLAVILGGCEE